MIQTTIGINHCLGSNVLINLEPLQPRLLASLTLVEAIINEDATEIEQRFRVGIPTLISERDDWPWRIVAVDSVIRKPLHAS